MPDARGTDRGIALGPRAAQLALVTLANDGGLFSGPLVADRFSAGSKSALIPEQPVGRDGAISVPYAGRIKVAGRRPQDVQSLIENELAGKAIQPQVLVSVTKPISQAELNQGRAAAPTTATTVPSATTTVAP